MNGDSESLLSRFKKLNEIESNEKKRINFIESDYPSFFFKLLSKVFEEVVENLRKDGTDLNFQSFEDSEGEYSNRMLELKKRFRHSDEYDYDISFEDFISKIEEAEEREWYYQQVYEGEGDIEYEEYKADRDSTDEGNNYFIEEEDSGERVGYRNLECANRISIISFKNLDILMKITQESKTTIRLVNKNDEDDYFDLDESDYGRDDESCYYYRGETTIFNPNLNIRYFKGNFDQLSKEQNYPIEVDQNFNALWGKENNDSLTHIVFSWFLEEFEKQASGR